VVILRDQAEESDCTSGHIYPPSGQSVKYEGSRGGSGSRNRDWSRDGDWELLKCLASPRDFPMGRGTMRVQCRIMGNNQLVDRSGQTYGMSLVWLAVDGESIGKP